MCLSLLSNLYLLATIGILDADWQTEYYYNDISWCEVQNDWIDLSNDLILELQYCSYEYDELELIDPVDCWATEEGE